MESLHPQGWGDGLIEIVQYKIKFPSNDDLFNWNVQVYDDALLTNVFECWYDGLCLVMQVFLGYCRLEFSCYEGKQHQKLLGILRKYPEQLEGDWYVIITWLEHDGDRLVLSLDHVTLYFCIFSILFLYSLFITFRLHTDFYQSLRPLLNIPTLPSKPINYRTQLITIHLQLMLLTTGNPHRPCHRHLQHSKHGSLN